MIPEKSDPLELFAAWYAEADKSEPNDPSALSLATVGPDGTPAVRMVLLKGFDASGFVFYTNHESRKGEHLLAHPKAAMLFHWKSLRRQVRLEGPVAPTTAEEADAYFASRDRGSQIGAWASEQSRPLESRFALEKRVAEFTRPARDRQGAAAAALVGLPPETRADRVLAGWRVPPARPAGVSPAVARRAVDDPHALSLTRRRRDRPSVLRGRGPERGHRLPHEASGARAAHRHARRGRVPHPRSAATSSSAP